MSDNQKTETLLREHIRSRIKHILLEERKKEQQLRLVIRSLIKEAKDTANPHPSTGINKLRDAFRKAKPTLKSMFLQLTTSEEQRKSFTNHILSAFIRLFDELDAMNAEGSPEIDAPAVDAVTSDLQAPPDDFDDMINEIEVKIKDDMDIVTADEEPEPKSQVEKDVAKKKDQEAEREEFSSNLKGLDVTGRNQAFDTFRLVQSYFSDAYLDLANEGDKEMFKDWCLYNLDLLMKSFEQQLDPNLERPDIQAPEGA